MNRGAVPDLVPALPRGIGIETGGHEDRTAARVVVKDLRRVGWQDETVLARPSADRGAAAFEDGDVERINPGLEDDSDLILRRRGEHQCPRFFQRALRLADQPL